MHRLITQAEIDSLIDERTSELESRASDLEDEVEKLQAELVNLQSIAEQPTLPVLGLKKDSDSNSVVYQWTGPYDTILHLSCPLGDKMGISEIIDSMIQK
jgi:hypothetical protein